jgi:transposase
MLRENTQIKISLYRELYDIVIPKDNLLRRIKESLDFSFVNPMLRDQYCAHFGRPAKEPELMFKLLFLKKLYDLSDEMLIQSAAVNMAYKYFLELDPEDELIDSSLLTKFRKTRITEDILEEMLKETIRQAINKGLIKSTAIIVDATHVRANATAKKPTELLREMTKKLRLEIYKSLYELSEKFPDKPSETADLSEEIDYSRNLLEAVDEGISASGSAELRGLRDQINELLSNEKIREIRSVQDQDAKFGHKSPTNTFFGYKTHMAMTEERLITAVQVTSGEACDGDVMRNLAEQSSKNGIAVREINGDTAYSTGANIEYCNGNDIRLISPLNPIISNSVLPKEDGFVYNKDAGTLQCPGGCLAMSCRRQKGKNRYHNSTNVYHFSRVQCRRCPMCEKCRVGLSKTNTYAVSIASDLHKAQLEFQQSDYFRRRSRQRYKIEAKNAEMKLSHGLERADSTGITAMQLQSYFTAFAVNVKRIIQLIDPLAV